MANVRECRECHKMVDFDEPWCDHETMEESGWLNIPRGVREARWLAVYDQAVDIVIDDLVEQAAKELGWHAGQDLNEKLKGDLE